MAQLKNVLIKIVLIITIISIFIMFCATPASNAKLSMGEEDFYYSGTTKGTYTVTEGIFSWLVQNIGDIADWIIGIITMGFRMVFVGWTALIERLLTWGLETASGINLEGGDINATDISELEDSSRNVTIQGIVYNMVPALNINFFNTDYKKLYIKEDKVISPTGNELKCEKCNKPVKKCCDKLDLSSDLTEIKEENNYCNNSCNCNGTCNGCMLYKQLMKSDNEPIVIQIKRLVALFYNIIRISAVAVMLVLLIATGIKMLITSIAQEKALYKRMLVDWLAGLIILFSIHYIMYIAIYITETAVKVVADAADSINEVTLKHLVENDPDQINTDGIVILSDQEIEIDVYEAIRTRAYDAKLTVGLSGMLMYIALVYFAVKYTFVYVKRFLVLAFLTVAGPMIGSSYALQKVFFGKAPSFKKWMSEYILNLMIQVVHAILYGVFISNALIYSLESVAGMIFALILMHYTFEAENMFRKIFNFDPSNSGLLGSTMEAGNLKSKFDTAKGVLIGGKTAGKILMNTHYSKAVKTVGKAIVSGAIVGTAVARDRISSSLLNNNDSSSIHNEIENQNNNEEQNNEQNHTESLEGNIDARRNPKMHDFKQRLDKKREEMKQNQMEEDGEILAEGKDNLFAKMKDAYREYNLNPTKQNKKKAFEAERKFYRYTELMKKNNAKGSELEGDNVLTSKINRLFNINSYYIIKRDKNGKVSYVFKNQSYQSKKNKDGIPKKYSGMINALIGSKYRDPITGKMINEGNGIYMQLSPTNLLGFSEEDKKIFKEEVLVPFRNGLIGIGSMFVGLGTIIENPKLGMSLLVGGATSAYGTTKKFTLAQEYRNRKFKFSRFSLKAIENISDEVIDRAKLERTKMMIRRIKQKHPGLYEKLKNSNVIPTTLKNFINSDGIKSLVHLTRGKKLMAGTVAGAATGAIIGVATGGIGAIPFMAIKGAGASFIPVRASFKVKDIKNKSFMRKYEKYLEIEEDSDNEYFINSENMKTSQRVKNYTRARFHRKKRKERIPSTGANFNKLYEHAYKQQKKQEKQAQEDKLNLMAVAARAEMSYQFDKYIESLQKELYEQQGYEYNSETGEIIESQNLIEERIRTESEQVIKEEELVEENNGKKITSVDREFINRKIDQVIMDIANGEYIDINDEQNLDRIVNELSDSLVLTHLIAPDQLASVLFIDGMDGLKVRIKNKAVYANRKIEVANQTLKDLTDEEQKIIKESVQESIKGMFGETRRKDNNSNQEKQPISYSRINPQLLVNKAKDIVQDNSRKSNGTYYNPKQIFNFGYNEQEIKDNTSFSDVEVQFGNFVVEYLVSKEIIESQQLQSDSEQGAVEEIRYTAEQVKNAEEFLKTVNPEQEKLMSEAIHEIEKNASKYISYSEVETHTVLDEVEKIIQNNDNEPETERLDLREVFNFAGIDPQLRNGTTPVTFSDVKVQFENLIIEYLRNKDIIEEFNIPKSQSKKKIVSRYTQREKIEAENFFRTINREQEKLINKALKQVMELEYEKDSKRLIYGTNQSIYTNVDPRLVLQSIREKINSSGSAEIVSQTEIDRKYSKVVENYLLSMKEMRESITTRKDRRVDQQIKNREKKETKKKVQQKIKRKRKQLVDILDEVYMGNQNEVIAQIQNDTESTQEQKNKTIETLLLFKELSDKGLAINEYAMNQLQMEKGSKAYLKAMQMETSASLDYNRDLLKVKQFELKYGTIGSIDITKLPLKAQQEYIEINKIKLGLEKKRVNANLASLNARRTGPIINIRNELISKLSK